MESRVSSPPLLPQAVYSHSKVTLTCRPARPLFVAGQQLDGILELACSSDKVWLGGIALEIRGAEQLHSRDHAASQAFMQADITFQSPNLPPSNAVIATSTSHSGFWPARKGVTRFPFSFPIPPNCPSSCKFAGNASVTYTLLASCQIQLENERQILTRRLDVNVVERWQDWALERFHEPSEAQVREKIQAGIGLGALGKTEGTIIAQALIQDRLFYRGWELPDGSLEIDRARGELCTHLSIRNVTNRTIPGLKLSLLRRLKVLPPPDAPTDQNLVISAASAPRITETVEEINLHGRGWEFPPSDDERVVDCIMPLPTPDKFLSIRKTKLFEIHTLVKITLDMGTLNKPISFELPIWVADWASLPPGALQPHSLMSPPTNPPMMRPASSQGLVRARSAGSYMEQQPVQDTFGRRTPLGNRSPFTMPQPIPQQRGYASTPSYIDDHVKPAVPLEIPYQSSSHNPTFIQFDPHAASMTPSRFMHQDNPWLLPTQDSHHWAAIQSPTQAEFAPVSLASSAPASSYFQMLAQQRMTPSPKLPESLTTQQPNLPRSNSTDSRLQSSSSVSPYTQRTLPRKVQESLTEEEQARVLANSTPNTYQVNERAFTMRQQQELQNGNSLAGNASPASIGRQRRRSMPTPPSAVQGRFSPIEATPSRPFKTPPLAPSSRFTFALPYMPAAAESPDQMPGVMTGLETIGEDGESQAGTLRFSKGSLGRSASHEQIRSLKAVRAVNTAVDEDGNTSVSLLEGIAEQQDREKEAANRREEMENQNNTNTLAGLYSSSSPNVDKTLPKPPPPSEKHNATDESSHSRRRIFDIFPEIEDSASPPKASTDRYKSAKSPVKQPIQTRAVSNPTSNDYKRAPLQVSISRPMMKTSKSDSLIALEARLSKPSSPMSPTFGNDRPPSLSPPLTAETTAAANIRRAVSPVHIGNQGALRKKSSQLSMRKQARNTNDQSAPSARGEAVHVEKLPVSELPSAASSDAQASTSRPPTKQTSTEAHVKRVVAKSDRLISSSAPTFSSSDVSGQKAKTDAQKFPRTDHLSTPLRPGERGKLASQRKTVTLAQRSPKNPLSSSSPASGKRHASDPQTQAGSSTSSSKHAISAARRQSLDVPATLIDQYGSARGGRGGRVASVASLWADIISQESKNAKNEATIANPVSNRKQATSVAKNVALSESRATENLHRAVENASEAKVNSSAGKTPAPVNNTLAFAKSPSPRAVKSSSSAPSAPKAQVVIASINATVGKPPVFVKTSRNAAPAASASESTANAVDSKANNNLRALIAKFS